MTYNVPSMALNHMIVIIVNIIITGNRI